MNIAYILSKQPISIYNMRIYKNKLLNKYCSPPLLFFFYFSYFKFCKLNLKKMCVSTDNEHFAKPLFSLLLIKVQPALLQEGRISSGPKILTKFCWRNKNLIKSPSLTLKLVIESGFHWPLAPKESVRSHYFVFQTKGN